MKNSGAKAETPEFTRKNGNVFAQLERPDADDLLRKTRVMNLINDVVKRRGLTQEAAAELAGVDQADVSRLANGRVGGFSLGRLMTIVDRLGIEIHFEQRRDKHGHLVVEARELSRERAHS
jgi:predicted XRE-type DNA-binding protein